MSERKELDVLDVRRPKKIKPKSDAKPKKRITYETTTVVLALICSFMAIFIAYMYGKIICNTPGTYIATFVFAPFFLWLGILYICDKVTKEKTPADDGQSNSKGRANRQCDY